MQIVKKQGVSMKKIIIYDFDGTLTPYPMPKLEILEKCGIVGGATNPNFISRAMKKSKEDNISLYEAFYSVAFATMQENEKEVTDNTISLGADNLVYNKGVVEFLEKLTEKKIDNYVVSSGMKPYLEHTKVAKYFKDIYATTFTYDKENKINGIDFLMTDQNKEVTIKTILKANNIEEDNCKDLIYIGDGLSDYYAMKYVKEHGGITILVYLDNNQKEVMTMKEKQIVTKAVKADFSKDSDLYNEIVKKL